MDRLGEVEGGKIRFASYRSLLSRRLGLKELQSSSVEFFRIPSVAPSLSGENLLLNGSQTTV